MPSVSWVLSEHGTVKDAYADMGRPGDGLEEGFWAGVGEDVDLVRLGKV